MILLLAESLIGIDVCKKFRYFSNGRYLRSKNTMN